jgi:transcriptional regulator with XRE-family HTH domain
LGPTGLSRESTSASVLAVPTAAGPSRPSAEAITAVIADRVRVLRDKAGLSQADLAGEMEKLGVPWKRATVVNLETRAAGSRGKGAGRDVVTAQELLALARVFDVPLIWLLADPKSGDTVPLTKDEAVDPWTALMWMAGEQPLHDESGSWRDAVQPLGHVRMIRQILDQLAEDHRRRPLLDQLVDEAGTPLFPADLSKEKARYRALGQALEQLRSRGYRLPPVPNDLAERARELDVALPAAED